MKNILTFVCCIEQGRLEKQTLLMLDTLRSNAGEFANCHVIAVVGRFGAKLSPKTIELLKQFNVELYVAKNENPYAWFNYSNKVVAVNVAQRKAKTPCIAWLDSDVLFLNQPNGFMLNDEEDFLASLDYFPPAVVEKELTQIPYWQSLCSILNVDFSNIPIVKNQLNNKSQHIYLSSGVMVWRKDTNFAIAYRDAFVKVMASKLAQHNGTFFTADQVILSVIVHKEKLRWRNLAYPDHHVTIPGQIEGISQSPSMQTSNVLHYSQSLSPPFRTKYLLRLNEECPAIISFIQKNDQLNLTNTQLQLLVAKTLRVFRGMRWRIFEKTIKKTNIG